MRARLLAALLFAAIVAGCGPHTYRQSATPVPGYGNSVRQNSAVMIVDPQPASATNTMIDMDGRRSLIAIERYRSDTTIVPETLDTTTVLPLASGDGTGDSGDAETQ